MTTPRKTDHPRFPFFPAAPSLSSFCGRRARFCDAGLTAQSHLKRATLKSFGDSQSRV